MVKYEDNFDKLINAIDSIVARAMDETALFILQMVRVFAPVRTGALRDSYTIQKESVLRILIGSMLEYSIYQEFGTSRMSAQPHLTPAFALGGRVLQEKIADGINATA